MSSFGFIALHQCDVPQFSQEVSLPWRLAYPPVRVMNPSFERHAADVPYAAFSFCLGVALLYVCVMQTLQFADVIKWILRGNFIPRFTSFVLEVDLRVNLSWSRGLQTGFLPFLCPKATALGPAGRARLCFCGAVCGSVALDIFMYVSRN